MNKSAFFQQKKKGIILVLLGLLLASAIILFLYFTVIRIQGFPELLPAEATAAYTEFPAHFSEIVGPESLAKINKLLKLDWGKEVEPWAQEKAAIAFFTTADPNKLMPLLLIEVKDREQAAAFLENYKSRMSGSAFAFAGNIAVVALSKEALAAFTSYQTGIAKNLGSDANFVRVRQNTHGQFFLYLKPQSMPDGFYESVASLVPNMPPLMLNLPAIGIGAEKNPDSNGGAWLGNSYLMTPSLLSLNPEEAYRALLIPFLPPDFDAMISGQNAAGQLQKIDALIGQQQELPQLNKIIDAAVQEYFPGAVFEMDIAPLVQGEFALAVSGPRALFITELPEVAATERIAHLRAAFQTITQNFALTEKDFTLLDGTHARELVPNPADVAPYKEDFNAIQITGFTWNTGATGIFDVITQNKWFISNDLGMLKKSLQLTQAPGESFRETDRYRASLQPILKNPELLGTATLPEGVFSFSKRTFADHIETNFMFR